MLAEDEETLAATRGRSAANPPVAPTPPPSTTPSRGSSPAPSQASECTRVFWIRWSIFNLFEPFKGSNIPIEDVSPVQLYCFNRFQLGIYSHTVGGQCGWWASSPGSGKDWVVGRQVGREIWESPHSSQWKVKRPRRRRSSHCLPRWHCCTLP